MLKKIVLSLFAIILLGGGYFLSVMISTGFFRTIENQAFGPVIKKIPIIGAEDLTVDHSSGLLFISSYDRAAKTRGEKPTGGIYVMNLNDPNLPPIRLDDDLGEGFHPHGISLMKIDSAMYLLWIVNHQEEKHTIELFEFIPNDHFAHIRTFDDPLIKSPNDVVAMNKRQFYFTNDHGKTKGLGLMAENYLGLSYSNVVYYDGKDFSIAATDISYANGITKNRDGSQIYVASPRKFKLLVYDVLGDGALSLSKTIDVGTGIDNLEWDRDGKLWMGAHPNLLGFSAYSKLKRPVAPSEIITWNPQTNELESVFLDDGNLVSASTVGVMYKGQLFIGNVMDDGILVVAKD